MQTVFIYPGLSGNALRKAETVSQWKKLRPDLTRSHYQTFAPLSTVCAVCRQEVARIILCKDCGPLAYYCSECFQRHKKIAPLHLGQQWQGEIFHPYNGGFATAILSIPGHGILLGDSCGSSKSSMLTVFDEHGKSR